MPNDRKRPATTFDVYEYLDYRLLLGDYYRAQKERGRGFSFRSFGRRAGVSSPNHMKRVIDGHRNLSTDSAERYAKAMGLQGSAAKYFSALVEFNQSKSSNSRQLAYDRMRSLSGYRRAHITDNRLAEYYSNWFVPAVREMAIQSNFVDDPKWIASNLRPRITVDEARRALRTLKELKMLVPDARGRLRQTDPVVATAEQTHSLHIRRYHETMLDHAKLAITAIPAPERLFGALTFCVGEAGYERVAERTRQFRNELIAMLAEEVNGDRVVHLGFQLFPLSQTKNGAP